jgi:hypothetical protein
MWRCLSIAAVGALLLALAGCGSSSVTRPASVTTRAAILKLVNTYVAEAHLPKHVKAHVVAADQVASDPHVVRVVMSLTGGPYGKAGGNRALAVAVEVFGRWSFVAGPGTGYDCTQPTEKTVLDLICPGGKPFSF